MNKNVSKGDALAHLLENRNYGLKDCIAFGDGQNDVEMLSLAGKGYVMANADPRLKEACPELEEIGFNKDEAVAKHLAKLLVSNKCFSRLFLLAQAQSSEHPYDGDWVFG